MFFCGLMTTAYISVTRRIYVAQGGLVVRQGSDDVLFLFESPRLPGPP